jgi:hypothetical protein
LRWPLSDFREEHYSMPLLQRIIEHFQNLVLVSDISLMLMGISIIIMSAYYAYFIISKKSNYESVIVKIGILVRVLMIIGLTIEFSHQKAIYHGSPIIDGKHRAMDQFVNYLFYGYIFVIGIYDIFTIGINKFRGFFHAFDLTIISMPILYGITYLMLNFGFNNDIFRIVIILISVLVLPYFFFNLYWKQNVKWYAIFLGYTILSLIIYKRVGMKIIFSSTLISYFLIGSYELGRHLFNKVRKTSTFSLWGKVKYASIVFPLVLIFSCIVTLNISPIEIEKKYHIDSVYRKDATFTTVEEAENLARIALNDNNSNIAHWQGTSEDFNNRYFFSLGDYSVEIDGAKGKIFDIRNRNKSENNKNETLTKEEIEVKTLKWLESVGFTYDEKRHNLKVEQEPNKYTVSIFNKFTDGTIDERSKSTIQWYLDGKLNYASLGSMFSNFKDYKDFKINEAIISQDLKNWYNKLGEEMPDYIIENFNYWFGDIDPFITVRCKNNDYFNIDIFTGKILSFHRNSNGQNNKLSFTNETYNEYENKAKKLADDFGSNWKDNDYTLQESISKERYYYSFVGNKDELNNNIDIGLDLEGNFKAFDERIDIRSKLYSDKEFKISSSTALKLVAKEYKTFSIYSKRVKLAAEIKDSGEINYKWMVVVLPFKKVEHQIYYVDVNTGKITPLLEYKN